MNGCIDSAHSQPLGAWLILIDSLFTQLATGQGSGWTFWWSCQWQGRSLVCITVPAAFSIRDERRRKTSVERLCFYGRSHVCLGGDGVALGRHSIVGSPRLPGGACWDDHLQWSKSIQTFFAGQSYEVARLWPSAWNQASKLLKVKTGKCAFNVQVVASCVLRLSHQHSWIKLPRVHRDSWCFSLATDLQWVSVNTGATTFLASWVWNTSAMLAPVVFIW